MTLIAMAVYDTEENNRTWMTKSTLHCIKDTVNLHKHRLFIIDNASCDETKDFLMYFRNTNPCTVITNKENVGTAKAVNQAWKLRQPDELAIKMDNDVEIYSEGWVELMEEVITRNPETGIVGLKRKDCIESPINDNQFYRSKLKFANHELGQRWIVLEEVNHVMGTCQMYNSALLDKIGYLYQMDGLYGFDDVLASIRSHHAGFNNYFVHGVEIDHIDPGTTSYQKWKEQYASMMFPVYERIKEEYKNGKSIYHEA